MKIENNKLVKINRLSHSNKSEKNTDTKQKRKSENEDDLLDVEFDGEIEINGKSVNIDISDYNVINPKQDKALGFLWKKGTYTYTSSSGVKITVEEISEDTKILEDPKTGEILVIGAKGAKINGSNGNSKITVYNSKIDEINTKKGDDELKIYNSEVDEISTGKGSDSITIEGSTINKKINTGFGDDFITVSDTTIDNLNTSSEFFWGLFDNSEDTVILNDTNAKNIKTGKGSDTVISDDSDIKNLKTGGKSNSISLDNTKVDNLKTDKEDCIVKNNNYESLDIDISKVSSIQSDGVVQIDEEGNTIPVNDYVQYILNQETGFKTEEEYQQYALESLTQSLQSMQEIFDSQEAKDGVISDGYNAIKELTGLSISDEDVKNILSKQQEIVDGLNAAINGESDMTFEEAYKHYLGVEFSTEKIDNYIKMSNTYNAVMLASQYDSDYIEKFEDATGSDIETIAHDYYLAQTDAMGRDTVLSELVDKYADDQNSFADKLSATISMAGLGCIVVGAVVSFIPGGAAVGLPLMTAGRYISLGGMFVDNAMDLTDGATSKNGLTEEELKNLALETGVEIASYAAGRGIGKFTSGLNGVVANKAAVAGFGKVGSYFAGQAAETITDTALSLGADYAIAQGQSYITTGEFMSAEDYFSADRFLGEGKNQLIGILTGLSSAKINSYQSGIYATAGAKLATEDLTSIKQYMKNSGLSDTQINKFFEGVDIETVASHSTVTANDNPTLSKMVADNTLSAEAADVFAKYGLSDSQISKAQNMVNSGLTPSEAAICTNYNLSSRAYNDACKISDNNPDTSFATAANIVKNKDVYNMLNKGQITLDDASIYAARNLNASQIKAAGEFKNKYPETNTSQAAIISSNKTISKMFEKGQIASVEEATIYAEMGLVKSQVQNAQKLQQDEQLSISAASILARNEVVFNMYKNGEITSVDDAVKYAQDYKYKGEVTRAINEKEQGQSSLTSRNILAGSVAQTATASGESTAIKKSAEIDDSSITTAELLRNAIKGSEFEEEFDSRDINNICKSVDYAYNRLSKSGVQLTREDVIRIAEKTGYSTTSITDLTGMTNEFGKAYLLLKLMDDGSVSENTMAKISDGVTQAGIFNLAYRDYFGEILKSSDLTNVPEVFEQIANSITKGTISTRQADAILDNIASLTSEDVRFIENNIGNNSFYTEQEYIQTFLYFKNLQTDNGIGILNMDELVQKMQQYGMGDTAAQVNVDETLYKNIKAMMNIDPSSIDASYMTMLIELIQTGEVNASALRSFDNVNDLRSIMYALSDAEDPNTIKSSDGWNYSTNLKSDIDKMCDVIASNKNKADLQTELLDAFVPVVKQNTDGIDTVNIGDAYKIEGEDGIRIKISDTESKLINMSRETYYKLFPPVDRYASSQQTLGDCYCIENMMLLYSLPDQRANLLEMFSEDESGNIKIKFPNCDFEVIFENGEFPKNQISDMYSSGAEGFKMLEYAYARTLIENEVAKAVQNLSGEELADFCNFIEKNSNDVFVYFDEQGQVHYAKYSEIYNDQPELIKKTIAAKNNSEMFTTVYPTLATTLLGNGGSQFSVLNAMDYDSILYIPEIKVPTDAEIDKQIEDIKNNPNLDESSKNDTIEYLKLYKGETPEKLEMQKMMEQQKEEMYKLYEDLGISRDRIKTFDGSILEQLKDPDFYKNNIVQFGIGAHAYGFECETDSSGNTVYYLYNPHNQGIPIKITDVDAFFNKEDLFQNIIITERKK